MRFEAMRGESRPELPPRVSEIVLKGQLLRFPSSGYGNCPWATPWTTTMSSTFPRCLSVPWKVDCGHSFPGAGPVLSTPLSCILAWERQRKFREKLSNPPSIGL